MTFDGKAVSSSSSEGIPSPRSDVSLESAESAATESATEVDGGGVSPAASVILASNQADQRTCGGVPTCVCVCVTMETVNTCNTNKQEREGRQRGDDGDNEKLFFCSGHHPHPSFLVRCDAAAGNGRGDP